MQPFPIDAIRRQFPAVTRNANRIYLDNPAGTQVPARVAEAVAQAMTAASSNLGGFFPDSEAADATWQAFWRTAVDGQSSKDTAAQLGMTVAAVYLARSRVVARLKDLVGSVQAP